MADNDQSRAVVALDRIEDRPEPDYCTHGRTACIACGAWCWLGHLTYEVVASGKAAPLCLPCTARYANSAQRIGHVADHQRADGPHEPGRK